MVNRNRREILPLLSQSLVYSSAFTNMSNVDNLLRISNGDMLLTLGMWK